MAKAPFKRTDLFKEMGVAGGATYRGEFNAGEFLQQLRGQRALRTYREMRDNDATVGAILSAMDMMLRAVEWRVTPTDDSEAAQSEAQFVEELFEDMSHTFEDFLSEVLTFLPFGFSFHEIVMKRRDGPEQTDPSRRSRYRDGRIGIRKLAPRAQWTLARWEFDEDGGTKAFVQQAANGEVAIPIEKGLLFRTVNVNNDPSGRSVLRNAYRSWFYLKNIQSIEAIAIERELNGIPVGRVPAEYLAPGVDGARKTFVDTFKSILRDVKLNEQGYILLPSDVYEDPEGKPTPQRMVEFELVSASGKRAIDTGSTIQRYQGDIARTVLADFIMLGSKAEGSYALSTSKTQLFLRSLQGYMGSIVAILNRHLLPRVWAVNGLNPDLMPSITHGDVGPTDLGELGEYIKSLSGSGATLFPDEDLENALRAKAELPEVPEDRELELLPGAGFPVAPNEGEE